MARSIQNVDALALVAELKDGGRDRNTALLLDLHPVRNRMAAVLLALDHAGLLNRSAVQQEFLCQRSFSGIRMRNDRKSSSSFNFTCYISHCASSMFFVLLICFIL